MKRKVFIFYYLIIFFIINLTIFFGLRIYSQKKFNQQVLDQLITGKSKFMDVTDDLCHFQILGEPKVEKEYVKINFWCANNSKARSTFALRAFPDKSPSGILKEYARIVNFDYQLINKNNWFCTLNDQQIDFDNLDPVPQASNIDCFENKGVTKHD